MSDTPTQPVNSSLRIATRFSLACAGLLFIAWLINFIGMAPDSGTGRTIGFITIGILFAFALAALAGFVFAAAALVKIVKKPGFYSGSRWLVLIVFLVNAVLTLLGAGLVATIVSVMTATRNA